MARLEYFLTTDDIQSRISGSIITPVYKTDHSLIILKLDFGGASRETGILKFNASLLNDDKYTNMIKKCMKEQI